MPIKVDKSGLERFKKNVEDLGNTKSVTLLELMSSAFVSAHSKFDNFESLLNSSDFKVESSEDFLAIPDDEWDAFIGANTDFSNWKEMQESAHANWIKSKIERGF